MSRIPIASLANGVLFATQTFASPSNPSGVPVLTPAVGVQCFVYDHDTATPAAIWTNELGSTPLVQPLTTNATGTVPGWIDTSLLPLDLVVALPSGNEVFVLAGGSSGGGSGVIASVFGRTGSVSAQTGDYTAGQVGADPAGSAAAAEAGAIAASDSLGSAAAAQAGAIAASDPAGSAAAAAAASIPIAQKAAPSGVASLDISGHLAAAQQPVSGALIPGPAIRPLARDILILDNNQGLNSNQYTSKVIAAEQFIPDGTGNMYMLYCGTGTLGPVHCLAVASGTPTSPASPDPRVNAFTDLGAITASGVAVSGDAPHIVIANGTYFLFYGTNSAPGAAIGVRTATQISGGAIIPLSTAMSAFSAQSTAVTPAPANITSLNLSQGGAGTLPNSLQTIGVTAIDPDGLESGFVSSTFTPTASSEIVVTWVAPATGETAGYNIYRAGVRIASVAHGTLTYTVTGSEAGGGAAAPAYTSSSCTRLDEPYVFFDAVANKWRMLFMGFNTAGTVEQIHLANLTAGAGYGSMTNGVFAFRKQNGSQPVIPAGNYAAVFGTTIPGGAGMATLYDYETVADPFVFQVGSYFVIGYSAGAQGAIATSNSYRIVLAYTKDFVTFTKMGVMRHPSAMKNPADATNGAALDGNGTNRACNGSWRGAMYVDANGVGHMACIATHNNAGGGNNDAQAYYYQFDLSGVIDAINGLRTVDPWVRVEAESADARLTLVGFGTSVGPLAYFSGGALGGTGGHALTSTTAGDSITFTFSGSAVRVAISRVTTARLVTITLDGGGTEGVNQFTNLDMTANAFTNHDPLFAAQFDRLTPGVHQLKVTVAGSGGNNLYVDCFDYIPTLGLPA